LAPQKVDGRDSFAAGRGRVKGVGEVFAQAPGTGDAFLRNNTQSSESIFCITTSHFDLYMQVIIHTYSPKPSVINPTLIEGARSVARKDERDQAKNENNCFYEGETPF
jgi:hypothetical protein